MRKEGFFDMFGVTDKLRNIYGVKKDEPIYEVEFEVVEENPEYPKEIKQEYLAWHNEGEYSLVQPNATCFAIQFPFHVFEYQGKERSNGQRFGTVTRLRIKNKKEI